MVIVTANGARTKSLGIIDNVPLTIGRMQTQSPFEVLESKDETLILGNKWLKKVDAVLDWSQSMLTIKKGVATERIPVIFTKFERMRVVEEADEDSSEEEVYLSDVESQDDIEYNS